MIFGRVFGDALAQQTFSPHFIPLGAPTQDTHDTFHQDDPGTKTNPEELYAP